MKNPEIQKENVKKITLRVPESVKEILQDRADSAKKSLNQFLLDQALGSGKSCQAEEFKQAQRLIHIQRMIDDLESQVLKAELQKEVASIWQSFGF